MRLQHISGLLYKGEAETVSLAQVYQVSASMSLHPYLPRLVKKIKGRLYVKKSKESPGGSLSSLQGSSHPYTLLLTTPGWVVKSVALSWGCCTPWTVTVSWFLLIQLLFMYLEMLTFVFSFIGSQPDVSFQAFPGVTQSILCLVRNASHQLLHLTMS